MLCFTNSKFLASTILEPANCYTCFARRCQMLLLLFSDSAREFCSKVILFFSLFGDFSYDASFF